MNLFLNFNWSNLFSRINYKRKAIDEDEQKFNREDKSNSIRFENDVTHRDDIHLLGHVALESAVAASHSYRKQPKDRETDI